MNRMQAFAVSILFISPISSFAKDKIVLEKVHLSEIRSAKESKVQVFPKPAECQNQECKPVGILNNGDEVLAFDQKDRFSSIFYKGTYESEPITGWVLTASLKDKADSLATNLKGLFKYKGGDPILQVACSLSEAKDRQVAVYCDGIWNSGSEEGAHLGAVNGKAVPSAKNELLIHDESMGICEVKFKRFGRYLAGEYTAGHRAHGCGGANVEFNLIYLSEK